MPKPIVTVTIVTWNSERMLRACLDSLFAQTLTDVEVIVVDNNSTDQTLTILQNYPLLTLFKQTSNLGFCKAHNLAISYAQGKYVLPLNPDIIMTETYLEKLIQVAENEAQVGIVAGKLLLKDPNALAEANLLLDSTGLFLEKTRRQFLRGHREPESDRYQQQEFVFGADGAAPLYRRQMLQDCQFEGQYFDETFFAYKEDVDLAWRAQLFGWKSVYTPDAIAFHLRTFKPGQRQGLSKGVRLHSVKNRYLLLIKNELGHTFIRHALHILFYDLKILIYLLLFEQSSLLGLYQALRFLPQALRWRKFIMAHKKVDGPYMLAWMK